MIKRYFTKKKKKNNVAIRLNIGGTKHTLFLEKEEREKAFHLTMFV